MAAAAAGPLATTELQKGEYVHVNLPPTTANSQSQTRSKWKYIHIFIFEKHTFTACKILVSYQWWYKQWWAFSIQRGQISINFDRQEQKSHSRLLSICFSSNLLSTFHETLGRLWLLFTPWDMEGACATYNLGAKKSWLYFMKCYQWAPNWIFKGDHTSIGG